MRLSREKLSSWPCWNCIGGVCALIFGRFCISLLKRCPHECASTTCSIWLLNSITFHHPYPYTIIYHHQLQSLRQPNHSFFSVSITVHVSYFTVCYFLFVVFSILSSIIIIFSKVYVFNSKSGCGCIHGCHRVNTKVYITCIFYICAIFVFILIFL